MNLVPLASRRRTSSTGESRTTRSTRWPRSPAPRRDTRARRSPEQIEGQSVSIEFFKVLRVTPLLGRTFTAEDATPTRNVVVISERFWRSRFASDPQILERILTLDGQAYNVIGVVPEDFQFLRPSVFWRIFSPQPGPYLRRARFVDVVGRLKPGVTLEAARADLKAVAENIAATSPATNKGQTVAIDPLRQSIVGDELQLTSLALGGVVACVLLIACANTASLLMARGARS